MAKLNYKSLLAVVLGICFSTSVKAQGLYDIDRKFFGAVAVGANFSQVDGDNFAGYHKRSPTASAIMFFKLDEENLAGSFELMYSQKGCRATDKQVPTLFNNGSGVLKSYSSVLHYAELPIMINYFDSKMNYFSAGVSYAYLFQQFEYVNDVNNISAYPFSKHDANFIISAHFKTFKKLYTGLRFNYSLLNIRQDSDPRLIKRSLQSNNVYTLRLMYML